jgi:chemotaxis protein histidine kinase CheA
MSDQFTERFAAVRQRFLGRLDARIELIASAMPQPDREDELGVLVLAHRKAHTLCGVGPTFGFVGTAMAARSIEQLMLAAVTAERTLTDGEIRRLREGIALLRSTVTAEMTPSG